MDELFTRTCDVDTAAMRRLVEELDAPARLRLALMVEDGHPIFVGLYRRHRACPARARLLALFLPGLHFFQTGLTRRNLGLAGLFAATGCGCLVWWLCELRQAPRRASAHNAALARRLLDHVDAMLAFGSTRSGERAAGKSMLG